MTLPALIALPASCSENARDSVHLWLSPSAYFDAGTELKYFRYRNVVFRDDVADDLLRPRVVAITCGLCLNRLARKLGIGDPPSRAAPIQMKRLGPKLIAIMR